VPAHFLLIGLIAPLLAAVGAPSAVGPAPPVNAPLPQRGLVIVLRSPDIDEMTRIALARVTGELTAARFRVSVMWLDPSREPSPQVESVAPESSPVAVFAISHVMDSAGDTISIWVCDRVGRRTTVQRMAVGGDNIRQDAEVLALKAIELIRGSIAGLWPAPRVAPATPPAAAGPATATAAATPIPPPATPAGVPATIAPPTMAVPNAPVETPPVPEPAVSEPWVAGGRPELLVGMGVAGLRDTGGQSTQWMGSLTAVARWAGGFAARASLAGLGSPVTLSGPGGTAVLHRALAALGAAWYWSAAGPADLYVSGALGLARNEVTGATTDAARAVHTGVAWTSTGSAGLGAQLRLGRGVSLAGAAELVWAWSRLDVAIGSSRTGAFLRPGTLFTLGLQASF
jgi:hypothetical protein